jgi:hypothetical protein
MHSLFDQLIKRLVRTGFSSGGLVETEAEVSPDNLRSDVYFLPDAARVQEVMAPLGLLGRIGSTSCTLEAYHCTPSDELVADALAKHRFFCRELARRKPCPPRPMQWILSSGRPSAALAGLGFCGSRWGSGIYDGPPLWRTRIVAINELPRTRDTLLVRLMGAGRTLKRAIADVQTLPLDAPERRLALPILIHLHVETRGNPVKQTKLDREFLMTTQQIGDYVDQLRQEGRKEGRDEGFAQAVLAAYGVRFGAPPRALVAAVKQAGDLAALQRWLAIVTTRSAEEVAAELRRPQTRRASAAPRRTSASR